jgi:hypothetical protein
VRASFSRSLRALAIALPIAALASASTAACGSSDDGADAGPRTCARDLDCGDHHYCSEANVCRTDCYVDADCLGPTKTAQCNAQGRCVETDLDAMPAEVDPEAGP